LKGTVLRDMGNSVVVDVGGEELTCTIRKRLRHDARGCRETKPVVVGDLVLLERTADAAGAVITSVEPRRCAISRPVPGQPRREQVLVANLDAVLIVASTRRPAFTPGVVDRFLVAAESRGLEAGIAINKIDLDPEASYAPFAAGYRKLGYRVMETSAARAEGLDGVRRFLGGKTTTLLGHSGVGKSSLANALDSSLNLHTREVHTRSGQGVHTTTTIALLRLPWGGHLVDTPGIREFGLWKMEPEELSHHFRELAAYAGGCRFKDCGHDHEPGCAVIRAVELGEIASWRYESYLRILADLREVREQRRRKG